jgi:hypothetical protein
LDDEDLLADLGPDSDDSADEDGAVIFFFRIILGDPSYVMIRFGL